MNDDEILKKIPPFALPREVTMGQILQDRSRGHTITKHGIVWAYLTGDVVSHTQGCQKT